MPALEKRGLSLIFDFGGVITDSPIVPLILYGTSVIQQAFRQGGVPFEDDEVQPNLFGDVIWFSREVHPPGVFKQLEIGALSRAEFVAAFQQELNLMLKYLQGVYTPSLPSSTSSTSRGGAAAAGFEKMLKRVRKNYPPEKFTSSVCEALTELADAESFISLSERVPFRQGLVEGLTVVKEVCKKEGVDLTLGVITNNWTQPVLMKPKKGEAPLPQHLKETVFASVVASHWPKPGLPFDFIVESVEEKVSKPDPEIYRRAMKQVPNTNRSLGGGVAVYFDDLPHNVSGALRANCGFTKAIRVERQRDIYFGVLEGMKSAGVSEIGCGKVLAVFNKSSRQRIFMKTLPDRVITAIPEKQQFTPEELLKLRNCLIDRLPQYFRFAFSKLASVPLQIEYFKGGMSNPTFRLTCYSGSFVLRKQPKGKLLKGAHDMKREYELFTYLGKKGIPVPRALCYVEDASVIGTPFYIMRYTAGHIVRNFEEMTKLPTALKDLPNAKQLHLNNVNNFFTSSIDACVKLHRAGIPEYLTKGKVISVPTQPKDTPLFRLVSTWKRQYDGGNARLKQFIDQGGKPKMDSLKSEPFEQLTDQLMHLITKKIVPLPSSLVLCHGDFKLDNMIYDVDPRAVRPGTPQMEKGPSVLALLDFELSAIGDPITDIAYCSLYQFLPSPRGIASLEDAEKKLFPTGQDLLRQYCEKTGYWSQFDEKTRNQLLAVYQAAMVHKLSGIMHGVVIRALVGNASDVQGGLALHEAFELLTDCGLGLIEDSGLLPPQQSSETPKSKL